MFEVQLENKALFVQINTRRLDTTNVEGLRARVEEYVTDPVASILVDMSGVEFIDSSGIGVLLSLQKCLQNDSHTVKLTNVEPAVHSIIELLHLKNAFDLQNSPKS